MGFACATACRSAAARTSPSSWPAAAREARLHGLRRRRLGDGPAARGSAWPKASTVADPLLRWLVLDGYGFHQAYFKTDKYVTGAVPGAGLPVAGRAARTGTRNHAIDQGIGRALWFVCGTDAELVARRSRSSPSPARRPVRRAGLAATYAGGVTADELAELVDRAGIHHGQLAQGSAFAAECRVRSGLLIPETEMAARAICGLSAERVAAITQEVRPAVVVDGDDVPAFETWRQRIAEEVLTHGGKKK